MKTKHLVFTLYIVAAVLTTGLALAAAAQEGPVPQNGVPDDWSHHHVMFSDPGTEQEALDRGTYEQWLAVVNNPRYIMQQLKRHAPAQGPAADDVARIEEADRVQQASGRQLVGVSAPGPQPPRRAKIQRDWSMNLGSGAKVGAGMYPAKFSFNGGPQCGNASSPDFVVYNTSLAGSSTQASIVAYYNLYTSCSGQVPSRLLGVQHRRNHLDLGCAFRLRFAVGLRPATQQRQRATGASEVGRETGGTQRDQRKHEHNERQQELHRRSGHATHQRGCRSRDCRDGNTIRRHHRQCVQRHCRHALHSSQRQRH